MSILVTLPCPPLDLTVPAAAAPPPLETILSASGPAFKGVFCPGGECPHPDAIRRGVDEAEEFLSTCAVHAESLRDAVQPLTDEQIGYQLAVFVSAWPNAAKADLAGYGAQLAEDIIERRPCRYALRWALRHLRQTSRFLPAIAEVLTALDEAQTRIRSTTWHIAQIPAELDRARAALAKADQRAVASARRENDASSLGAVA